MDMTIDRTKLERLRQLADMESQAALARLAQARSREEALHKARSALEMQARQANDQALGDPAMAPVAQFFHIWTARQAAALESEAADIAQEVALQRQSAARLFSRAEVLRVIRNRAGPRGRA